MVNSVKNETQMVGWGAVGANEIFWVFSSKFIFFNGL